MSDYEGVVEDSDRTEPPGRTSRGRRIVHHVGVRRGLLRKDPKRNDAEFVAAELSTRVHRNRVRTHHGRR